MNLEVPQTGMLLPDIQKNDEFTDKISASRHFLRTLTAPSPQTNNPMLFSPLTGRVLTAK